MSQLYTWVSEYDAWYLCKGQVMCMYRKDIFGLILKKQLPIRWNYMRCLKLGRDDVMW